MGGKYISKTQLCTVTGQPNPDLHHIKSRGAGGTDDAWNMIPLSRDLHRECHSTGLYGFSRKYTDVFKWLLDHGWTYDPVLIRWHHTDQKE